MVVRPGQVSGENQGEAASWTFCWQAADFALTSRAEVSPSSQIGMAGTQGRLVFNNSRREAHHQ